MTDRPDQSLVFDDRPATLEVSTLLALANRQRLQERETRERLVKQAVNQARRG